MEAFKVNMGPNADAQPWIPTPIADLSLIWKAANESGPDSSYFQQVTAQWSMQLQTYFDWYHLLKAVLEPAVYDHQAESQAQMNILMSQ